MKGLMECMLRASESRESLAPCPLPPLAGTVPGVGVASEGSAKDREGDTRRA